MPDKITKPHAPGKNLAKMYNIIPNVIWSLLSLAPVTFFSFTEMNPTCTICFFIISIMMGFMPTSFFNYIQLGKTTHVYTRLGIRLVKKFSQDGDVVNQYVRKRFYSYKVIQNAESGTKYINRMYSYERFHFILLVYFLFTSIFAIVQKQYIWAVCITLTNIFYNIYPILLQQYNRIRLTNLAERIRVRDN